MLPDSRHKISYEPSLRARAQKEAAGNARSPLTDPDFELIVSDPASAFRWHRHDYPSPLARWNYHPEFEIHMIAESSGKMFVGDHIGRFGPGNFLLVGPNLPHHWISDLNPDETHTGPRRGASVQRPVYWGRAKGFSRVRQNDPTPRSPRAAASSFKGGTLGSAAKS